MLLFLCLGEIIMKSKTNAIKTSKNLASLAGKKLSNRHTSKQVKRLAGGALGNRKKHT
jgi:hypothetical protein